MPYDEIEASFQTTLIFGELCRGVVEFFASIAIGPSNIARRGNRYIYKKITATLKPHIYFCFVIWTINYKKLSFLMTCQLLMKSDKSYIYN